MFSSIDSSDGIFDALADAADTVATSGRAIGSTDETTMAQSGVINYRTSNKESDHLSFDSIPARDTNHSLNNAQNSLPAEGTTPGGLIEQPTYQQTKTSSSTWIPSQPFTNNTVGHSVADDMLPKSQFIPVQQPSEWGASTDDVDFFNDHEHVTQHQAFQNNDSTAKPLHDGVLGDIAYTVNHDNRTGDDVNDDQPTAQATETAVDTLVAATNADQATAPQSWWGEDGFCYYDSAADGWRYYWDVQRQEWMQYCELSAVANNTIHASSDHGTHDKISEQKQEEHMPIEADHQQNYPSDAHSERVTYDAPRDEGPSQVIAPSSTTGAAGVPFLQATFPIPADMPPSMQENHHDANTMVADTVPLDITTTTPALLEEYGHQHMAAQTPPQLAFLPSTGPQVLQAPPTSSMAPAPPVYSSPLKSTGSITPSFLPTAAGTQTPALQNITHQQQYSQQPVPISPSQPSAQWYGHHMQPSSHIAQHDLHAALPFGKLVFGGKLMHVDPHGTISLYDVHALPSTMNPVGTTIVPSSLQQYTIQNELDILTSFPGPLQQQTSREKLVSFIDQRQEACISEEQDSATDIAAMHALWGILKAMAASPSPGRDAHSLYLKALSTVGSTINEVNASDKGVITSRPASPSPLKQTTGSSSPALAASHSEPSHLAHTSQPLSSLHHHHYHHLRVETVLATAGRSAALDAAIEGQQWPIVLVLGKMLGDAGWQKAIDAFVRCALPEGSPLASLCLAGTQGWESSSVFSEKMLAHWWQHAAMFVTDMTSANPAQNEWERSCLERLAALLCASGKTPAGHVCFVLAHSMLQCNDSGPLHFSVVGCSHMAMPRRYASLLGILRTEIYAWLIAGSAHGNGMMISV